VTLVSRIRFPHPLVLLSGAVFLAAAASWVLPAGNYDRVVDEATGRTVVVSGTFHPVEPAPVGPFDALVAMPRGMIHAAEIIFLVFLIGGELVAGEMEGLPRGRRCLFVQQSTEIEVSGLLAHLSSSSVTWKCVWHLYLTWVGTKY